MQQIDFLATDEIQLNGFLYKSEKQTNKVILSIHGMSSNCFKKRENVIANYANNSGIDYFCFNNRGSELIRYVRKNVNGKVEKILGGTTYENLLESYEDILGAVFKLRELGYQEIYLQGHSLGSTKIVYVYNKLKEEKRHNIFKNIKGIILLSLIDIPMTLKFYLRDNFNKYLRLAEEKENEGKIYDIMPKESFVHPISVKTFLIYARDNKEFDFARYGRDTELEKLNNIDKPIFMRWGNDKEMILQNTEDLVEIINKNITNDKKDIGYIDGANHGYHEKEEILAEQIMRFINQYK